MWWPRRLRTREAAQGAPPKASAFSFYSRRSCCSAFLSTAILPRRNPHHRTTTATCLALSSSTKLYQRIGCLKTVVFVCCTVHHFLRKKNQTSGDRAGAEQKAWDTCVRASARPVLVCLAWRSLQQADTKQHFVFFVTRTSIKISVVSPDNIKKEFQHRGGGKLKKWCIASDCEREELPFSFFPPSIIKTHSPSGACFDACVYSYLGTPPKSLLSLFSSMKCSHFPNSFFFDFEEKKRAQNDMNFEINFLFSCCCWWFLCL